MPTITTVLAALLLSAVATMVVIITFGAILHWSRPYVLEERSHGETPDSEGVSSNVNRTMPWYLDKIAPNRTRRCDLLASGDANERNQVKAYLSRKRSATQLVATPRNCSTIVGELSELFYVSTYEEEYPLAFAITVSEHSATILQYLRHLKVLYRPHNTYCYHVDRKSSEEFYKVFELITKCFDNIHMSLKSVNVYYGNASILNAQMHCYDTLMKKASTWTHVINLCGTELPLKTNREIVELLRPLRGLNVITNPQLIQPGITEQYIVNRLKYRAVWNEGRRHAMLGKDRLEPLPISYPVWKAITYMALTRNFISFLSTDNEALEFYKYLQDVQSPEEFFYSTMNQRESAPGGIYQARERNVSCNVPIVEAFWKQRRGRSDTCIDQYYIHGVCIVSVSDLPTIISKSALFFNKYLITYDHIVMDCVENALKMRNIKEYEKDWGLI